MRAWFSIKCDLFKNNNFNILEKMILTQNLFKKSVTTIFLIIIFYLNTKGNNLQYRCFWLIIRIVIIKVFLEHLYWFKLFNFLIDIVLAWSDWSEWTECSLQCGSTLSTASSRTRSRICPVTAGSSDVDCSGDAVETDTDSCDGRSSPCPDQHCPSGFHFSSGYKQNCFIIY